MKRFKLMTAAALALSLITSTAWAQPVKDRPAEQKEDQPGQTPGDKLTDKPAAPLPPKDEHPPQIGVVTQIVGYVRVYRWPYGYVIVPVTRNYYIVVVWNPKCSCYGVYDQAGVFYPYYGPLLGDAPQPKPSDKKSGAGKPAAK